MKLIVTGATGFVATEVIRQALCRKDITSIIAVARKPVTAPSDAADPSKLRSVIVSDYGTYSDAVTAEFQGADACIW